MVSRTDAYWCACDFKGTLDAVMKHCLEQIKVGDGGHAVMLRAKRESEARQSSGEAVSR